MSEKGWQFFWLDQQLDASSNAGLSPDQSRALQSDHHLVDGRRADAEMALQIGFCGSAAEDADIGVDEGQILALLGGEARLWDRGVHVT